MGVCRGAQDVRGRLCRSARFGFGQVSVGPTQLTIDFYDGSGNQTNEFAGEGNPRQACASLVIPKR